MIISIIIPTYNRILDLKECLVSILSQTTLPSEILVVDNANNLETELLINSLIQTFNEKSINLKYLKNKRYNSANVARNIGAECAIGDLLLFLDDDIILDSNFIKEIVSVYEKYPNAIGVQGYIENNKPGSSLQSFILRFFFLGHSKKNSNRLLPSIKDVYANPLTEIINCQWIMSGCTGYLKKYFDEYKFDEKMYKYCSGDDVDISYRIYNKYPGTLYQTPFAKLQHKTSAISRPPKKELVFTTEVYHTYLFYKIINPTYYNKCIFIWSRLGHLVTKSGILLLNPSKENMYLIINMASAYIYVLTNLKSIKKGDISFYTSTLE